jgi:uncharacterized protein (DUF2147 family)
MKRTVNKKTWFTTLLLSVGISTAALAQQTLGVWFTEKKDAKVEIGTLANGQLEGKIVWIKGGDSPEAKALIGTAVLRNLKKVDNEKYEGKAYDPTSKKEYNCSVTLKNTNTLVVRGYVGVSLFGSSQNWTRAAL